MFKFVQSKERAEVEAENWQKAYGKRFAVRSEEWLGACAVIMPRFRQLRTVEERRENLLKVKAALLENFAKKGLEHHDVKWRNIGYYLGQKGEIVVVVLDLADVECHGGSKKNEEWVTDCIDYLEQRAEESA